MLLDAGSGLKFVDDLGGPLNALIKESAQLDRFAGAGTQELPVGAQDVADLGMLESRARRDPSCLPGNGEDHLEMQGLRGPHDINGPVDMQLIDAVADGGEIGRRVVVAAVALADDDRQWLTVPPGETGRERTERTVADHGHAEALEGGAHVGENRAGEAFAPDVLIGERDPELTVDPVQVALGQVDEVLP